MSKDVMKVYAVEFDGVWRMGSAVIVAPDIKAAREQLRASLKRSGFGLYAADDASLRLVNLTRPRCLILSDGDI